MPTRPPILGRSLKTKNVRTKLVLVFVRVSTRLLTPASALEVDLFALSLSLGKRPIALVGAEVGTGTYRRARNDQCYDRADPYAKISLGWMCRQASGVCC